MQALQSPYVAETLREVMKSYPREGASLFGPSFNFNVFSSSNVALITQRKFELALRIDMCGSQALGFAVAAVRTILLLATRHKGHCLQVLGRSLKIGFFLCLQSMLSTQGDELGMIEDLDLAALWLHLVTFRFVLPFSSSSSSAASAVCSISAESFIAGGVQNVRPKSLLTSSLLEAADPLFSSSSSSPTSAPSEDRDSIGQAENDEIRIRRDAVS